MTGAKIKGNYGRLKITVILLCPGSFIFNVKNYKKTKKYFKVCEVLLHDEYFGNVKKKFEPRRKHGLFSYWLVPVLKLSLNSIIL